MHMPTGYFYLENQFWNLLNNRIEYISKDLLVHSVKVLMRQLLLRQLLLLQQLQVSFYVQIKTLVKIKEYAIW